jgi:hypothetical protein
MKKFFSILVLATSLAVSLPSIECTAQKKANLSVTRASKSTTARVTNFREGDPLTTTSLFYNQAASTLTVKGRFDKVPSSIKDSDVKVVVSGFNITNIAGASIRITRPAKAGKFMRVGFSVPLPAPSRSIFPMVDVVIELVFKKTDQVLARDVISLYDLRNSSASSTGDPTTTGVSFTSQLSNPGLGQGPTARIEGLEVPIFSNAPFPDLTTFNQRLTLAAARTPTLELDNLVSQFNTCIKLSDLEEGRFANPVAFPAYAEALAEANALYAAYLAVQNGVAACGLAAPLCKLILDGASCVQNPPKTEDFELCINRIIGRPTSLSVNRMSDLSMQFIDGATPSTGAIEANVDFEGYNGLVTGRLQDFAVRWRGSACSPLLRPLARLNNDKTIEIDWLNNWSMCRDMNLDSARATTRSNPSHSPQYTIQKDPASETRVYVTDARLAEFSLFNQLYNAAKGSCGLAFIAPAAETYLQMFSPQLATILGTTWNFGAPESLMSQQLDLLFRPFAVGDQTLPFHSINAHISGVRSSAVSGLLLDWNTTVSPTEEEAFRKLARTVFVNSQGPAIQSVNALDEQGASFDSSYGVTLNYINKVLWARSAGSEVNQTLTFTPSGGGIGGSPGIGGGLPSVPGAAPPAPSATLSGATLAGIHPGFKELVGRNFELKVERVLDPLMYMPEDPMQIIPGVGLPIRYGIRSLRMVLKEQDTLKGAQVTNRGRTVVEFDVSFLDDDFSLSINNAPGAILLTPVAPTITWFTNVKDSDLLRCAMYSHERGIPQQGSCEREMESAINLLVKDQLASIFTSLVSNVPAPQFFNVEGAALQTVQLADQSKAQVQGRITLFGQYN